MQTTINQIENKVKNHRRGKIFFLDNFAALGTPDAVKKSLQSLALTGLLVRLERLKRLNKQINETVKIA